MLLWICIYRVVRCGFFMGVLNIIVLGGGCYLLDENIYVCYGLSS